MKKNILSLFTLLIGSEQGYARCLLFLSAIVFTLGGIIVELILRNWVLLWVGMILCILWILNLIRDRIIEGRRKNKDDNATSNKN